jgi:hypothetical protein
MWVVLCFKEVSHEYAWFSVRLVAMDSGREIMSHRPSLPQSSDLAFVRAAGFCRFGELRPDFIYRGREDVRFYDAEAILPTRPYGRPTTAPTFEGYWLDGTAFTDDEDW